jgi:hypothetical protein
MSLYILPNTGWAKRLVVDRNCHWALKLSSDNKGKYLKCKVLLPMIIVIVSEASPSALT